MLPRGRRWGTVEHRALVERHLAAGDPTGWFEPVYAAALPRLTRLPWPAGAVSPLLAGWLTADARPVAGTRVAVVGCGVGDDAASLAAGGAQVTGIDVAPTALRWAARRFPGQGVVWREGDVVDPAADLLGAFELVVAVDVVSWLPGVVRDAAMTGIAGLVAPGGTAVVVDAAATRAEPSTAAPGPPWPQAPSELTTYRAAGLERTSLEHAPGSTVDGDVMRVRTTWRRPAPIDG